MISITPQLPLHQTALPQEGAQGRFKFSWSFLPPLLILAASVTGIVIAILFEIEYMTLPFGVVGASDIYFFYVVLSWKDLHTFEANNSSLKGSIGTLNTQVHTLESTNHDLQREVTHFRTSNETFTSQVEDLKKENSIYAAENSQLQHHIDTLKEELTQLQTHLTALGDVIENINCATEQQAQVFDAAAEKLEKHLAALPEGKVLRKTTEEITALLTLISSWKNSSQEISNNIHNLILLQTQSSALAQTLAQHEKSLDLIKRDIQLETENKKRLLEQFAQQINQLELQLQRQDNQSSQFIQEIRETLKDLKLQ